MVLKIYLARQPGVWVRLGTIMLPNEFHLNFENQKSKASFV
jgi:hypothetical protein